MASRHLLFVLSAGSRQLSDRRVRQVLSIIHTRHRHFYVNNWLEVRQAAYIRHDISIHHLLLLQEAEAHPFR